MLIIYLFHKYDNKLLVTNTLVDIGWIRILLSGLLVLEISVWSQRNMGTEMCSTGMVLFRPTKHHGGWTVEETFYREHLLSASNTTIKGNPVTFISMYNLLFIIYFLVYPFIDHGEHTRHVNLERCQLLYFVGLESNLISMVEICTRYRNTYLNYL